MLLSKSSDQFQKREPYKNVRDVPVPSRFYSAWVVVVVIVTAGENALHIIIILSGALSIYLPRSAYYVIARHRCTARASRS